MDWCPPLVVGYPLVERLSSWGCVHGSCCHCLTVGPLFPKYVSQAEASALQQQQYYQWYQQYNYAYPYSYYYPMVSAWLESEKWVMRWRQPR
jgi:hypothetical protein